MKFRSDLKFQTAMKAVMRVRVVKPIRVWFGETIIGRWMTTPTPIVLKQFSIHMDDVGRNILFQRNKSIGCTFKITREGKAQVQSVLPLSV